MESGAASSVEHLPPTAAAAGPRAADSTPTDDTILLQVDNLRKEYRSGSQPLVLFENLNLTVRRGEIVAIVGESGSGKSTLLHLLAALDRPSAGTVYCASTWLGQLTTAEAATFRNREIGYVWQTHYLLPEFTALENAAMPLLARGQPRSVAFTKAGELLSEVGLEARMHHRAGELSGGEQQRVSLARALVTQPSLLLADEPTGNLDNRTAEAVFNLIARLHTSHRLTSILVTHNLEIASRCGRTLRLHQGRLHEIREQTGDPEDAFPEGTFSERPSACTRNPEGTPGHPIARTAFPGASSPETT